MKNKKSQLVICEIILLVVVLIAECLCFQCIYYDNKVSSLEEQLNITRRKN